MSKSKQSQGSAATSAAGPAITLLGKLNVEDGSDNNYYNLNGNVLLEESHSILLGETKYYYAKKKDGKLQIIETTNSKLPTGNNVVADASVWSSTPVAISQSDKPNAGKRLGVYWETQKPIPDDTNQTPLSAGMIRLVGRYWSKDSVYDVTLNASYQGLTASIVVEVKKPGKLGSRVNGTVKDVFGHDISLNDSIYKYAGDNGIPPQIIKGQMLKESSFRPVWRYEPFQDVSIQGNHFYDYFSEGLPFVVTETTMGSGDSPTLHTNEKPGEYLKDPTKIATYTVKHWWDQYVQRGSGSTPDRILGSKDLSSRWKTLYEEIKKDDTKNLNDSAARLEAHNDLKDQIQDVKTPLGKSFDIIAQTRKVTSYGFTQMMYTTAAVDSFYKETDGRYASTGTPYVDQQNTSEFPEKLNEIDFSMPRYSDFLLKCLNFQFTGRIPFFQWIGKSQTLGFDANWKAALQKYNPGESTYAGVVLGNSKTFYPSK